MATKQQINMKQRQRETLLTVVRLRLEVNVMLSTTVDLKIVYRLLRTSMYC